ncbi:hypothetical protein QJ857_gp0320 [Tupanvirus soda lake]|uniref:Uncharacterized protein n=2 Tax=Tupanvirus TaxID=2094720 RepID=A0A6N1NMU0_9VIRU|nr:hypothetical protein QJ857_gp0320 [Tupanvirus soda lake]QKU35709.1 hypothetical protein [Tupanvirus soda lake]
MITSRVNFGLHRVMTKSSTVPISQRSVFTKPLKTPIKLFKENKHKMAVIESENKMTDKYNNPKVFVSAWGKLRGKEILNQNLLINGFGDIHPFANPPVFVNAKNIFLNDNHKYFHYYWINKKIFPTKPTIYLCGHPCDSPVLDRGFRMHVVDPFYYTAIRYANEIGADTSLIHYLTKTEYNNLVHSHEMEEVNMVDSDQNESSFSEPTEKNFKECHNNIAAALMKNAGWNL